MKKIINIFLVFALLFSCVLPVKANTDISQGANKGDLRLGTYKSSNKNKVELIKTDSNGVTVKKVVTKTTAGNYDVEFFVTGPTITATTQIKVPVYVVFVIDRSYSMRLDKRWTNATKAAVDISEQFKTLGVNMAVVGFSGGRNRSEANGGDNIAYNDTVDIRPNFSTDSISQSVFDKWGYDTNHDTGGGTNMQAGLKRAKELLNGKNGLKHIILLSDGVPTFYYNEDGYSKGAGNSNTDERIEQVPGVVDETIAAANAIKQSGITIHTIGYHFDKLTYVHSNNNSLNERALAEKTLKGVASSLSNYHIVNSYEETNLVIEFNNIKTDISTISVANNPAITDGIGNNFKVVGSSSYGGSKELKKTNFAVSNMTSIGKFSIKIDPNSPTGWYATNNNFTLSYTHATKGIQNIKITENPEVFWSKPAPYTIYHVERGNINNVLKTESGTAEFKSNVPVARKSFTGYTYHSQNKDNILIDTANNTAYVYYDRNLYGYTIKHVELGNEANVLDIETNTAKYGEAISISKKDFKGFTYVKQDKQKIIIDTKNNTATIYYTRNSYDYTIKHLEFDNQANVLGSNNGTAQYEDIIEVKEQDFKGFTYHSQDKDKIVIDTNNNTAMVFYTRNSYDYTIKHVELDNEDNVLEVETNNAKFGETISVTEQDFEGFSYDSKDKTNIVISTIDNTATIYYKRNNYSYKVEHYKETLDGNFKLIEEDTIIYNDLPYGSETTYEVNEYVGYTYDESKTENAQKLVPANNDLVIRLYYTLNDSKAIIYYVVKEGDYYYPFSEYGVLEENLLSFENVNLNNQIIEGKFGMPFTTEYRIVPDYYLNGLYAGNILKNPNLTKLDQKTLSDNLGVNVKEYTYVYEAIFGEGDGEEDIILPPQTGFERSLNTFDYILLLWAAILLLIKSRHYFKN